MMIKNGPEKDNSFVNETEKIKQVECVRRALELLHRSYEMRQ